MSSASGDEGDRMPILRMRGISKRFPGVDALRDVSVTVRRGEVLGLVGENGAGKSTLMKVLSGAYPADGGEIRIDGELIERPTPPRMIELGVAVIYQEMMIAPHLTVAENLFLGRLPRGRLGLVDWAAAAKRSTAIMARLGFRVDPRARLDTLSVAQRQMVEIARALSRNARLVILDEPSAVLGGAELDRLFDVVRRLSAEGVSFVYISHRLQEVFAICDRVTVLRDGTVVGTREIAEADPTSLTTSSRPKASSTATRSPRARSSMRRSSCRRTRSTRPTSTSGWARGSDPSPEGAPRSRRGAPPPSAATNQGVANGYRP